MIEKKYALLDTDFISKLHITRKDDQNRLIDKILELPGYQFLCHEQITFELERHNTTAIDWLQRKIADGVIQKYSDADFIIKIANCDENVGNDNNLGEIKTYLLQQILQTQEEIKLYVFCSDDKNARDGLAYGGGIPCISALSSFYILKRKLGMERDEARLYFDSWMQYHQMYKQVDFKVHKDTKEMQLIKMNGYEIFDRIYDGTLTIMKNGNLKLVHTSSSK